MDNNNGNNGNTDAKRKYTGVKYGKDYDNESSFAEGVVNFFKTVFLISLSVFLLITTYNKAHEFNFNDKTYILMSTELDSNGVYKNYYQVKGDFNPENSKESLIVAQRIGSSNTLKSIENYYKKIWIKNRRSIKIGPIYNGNQLIIGYCNVVKKEVVCMYSKNEISNNAETSYYYNTTYNKITKDDLVKGIEALKKLELKIIKKPGYKNNIYIICQNFMKIFGGSSK